MKGYGIKKKKTEYLINDKIKYNLSLILKSTIHIIKKLNN